MRMSGSMVVVEVSDERIVAIARVVGFMGYSMVVELVQEVEIVRWLTFVWFDGSKGFECFVDCRKLDEVASVVSSKETDEFSDVEVAQE